MSTETTTLPDVDLPELPDTLTLGEIDPDSAGKLCQVRYGEGNPGPRCTEWATRKVIGLCSSCFGPLFAYACEPCTELLIELAAKQDTASSRAGCCWQKQPPGVFLLSDVLPL